MQDRIKSPTGISRNTRHQISRIATPSGQEAMELGWGHRKPIYWQAVARHFDRMMNRSRKLASSETWTRIRIFLGPFQRGHSSIALSFRRKLFTAPPFPSRHHDRFDASTRNPWKYKKLPISPRNIHGKGIRFSLSETRGVQRDSGELGQVGWPAVVRDSGSKH